MINRISFQIKRFNNNIRMQKLNAFIVYFDFLVSFILYGVSFKGYFAYRFYNKNWRDKRNFITYKKSRKVIKKFNDASNIDFLLNKAIFNFKFYNFIKRDWLLVEDKNTNEIQEFLNRHSKCFLKPIDGSCGRNTVIVDSSKVDSDYLLSKYRGFLIEQVINQNELLKRINMTSVNTIRVLTAKNNLDEVKIIAAVIRIGMKDKIVDNIHSGGMCAQIDIDTGIVFTQAINTQYESFINHPDSNVQILGLSIPNWSIIKETVLICAKELRNINYVGWDFAITNDGCDLIEANHDPDHNLIQMADQKGKYKILIEALKKRNRK